MMQIWFAALQRSTKLRVRFSFSMRLRLSYSHEISYFQIFKLKKLLQTAVSHGSHESWAISDQPCHSFTQLVESVAMVAPRPRVTRVTGSHRQSGKTSQKRGQNQACIKMYIGIIWHNILKHLKLRYSILQHVTACYSTFLEFSRVRSFDQVLHRKMEPAPEPAHPIRRPYPSWPVSWWVFASRSLLSRFHSGVFQRGTWWNDAPRIKAESPWGVLVSAKQRFLLGGFSQNITSIHIWHLAGNQVRALLFSLVQTNTNTTLLVSPEKKFDAATICQHMSTFGMCQHEK